MLEYPLQVGRYSTRVLEDGFRSQRCVVLVHGVTSRADRWRPAIRMLAEKGYRAIAVDLPGHGFASNGGDIAYSVPFFASFVLDTMTSLGVEHAGLVGTSLGGHVVAEMACQAPDRVESAVLVGSLGLVPTPQISARIGSRLLADEETSPDAVRQRLRRMCGSADLVTEEWAYEDWRFVHGPGMGDTLSSLGRYMREGVEGDLVGARLNALRDGLRILLIWGDADKSVPVAVGEMAAAAIARARLVTLPGAGHFPYLECPREFVDAVVGFLGPDGATGPAD